MRFEDLHILRVVIAAGSIASAATRLHRVPSGITARIQDLERDLGRPLFQREGRRLVPTAAGVAAAAHAEHVLHAVDTLRAVVADRPVPTRLRIGSLESTAALRMPAALARLQREHPGISIELRVTNGRDLTSALLNGELDAGLIADFPSDTRLASRYVFTETLVMIAPERQQPIRRPADVAKPVLIVFRPGCAYRARLESWCARGKIAPDRLVEVGSFHAMIGCVAAGMGIALVSEQMVAIHPARAYVGVHPLQPTLRRMRHALVRLKIVPNEAVELLANML